MKKHIIAIVCAGFLLCAPSANAFSLGRFITNPFNKHISSILHPFHIIYKLNGFTNSNPITGIPRISLRDDDQRWTYNYKKDDWEKYSWEIHPYVPPILYPPTDPRNPPPTSEQNPPCQRGGPGITPC
jgi:hypothetical protein